MLVVGVDGWKGGWIAVALEDGRFAGAEAFAELGEVVSAFRGAAVIAVDVPIGLPERGPRRADLEARAFLGRRWQSVFLTPPRAALEAPSHAEAVRRAPGVSRQAYGLRARIVEAERIRGLVEVHPEVSFVALAGGPLALGKKTWDGQAERRALLAGAGIELPDLLGAAGAVPPDDVLDAAVAAWSAGRIARGEAASLPSDPEPGEPRIRY